MAWALAQATGQGPCPRSAHAAAFVALGKNDSSDSNTVDTRRHLMVITGGWNGTRMLDDTFSFDCKLFRWAKLNIEGVRPCSRIGHSVITVGQELLLIGGLDDQKHPLNDVWLLKMSPKEQTQNSSLTNYFLPKSMPYVPSWQEIKYSGFFPARSRHSTVKWGKNALVFAGTDLQKPFSDLHMLNLETFEWKEIVFEHSPPPRCGHVMERISENRLVVYGGIGQTILNDIWLLDLSSMKWSELKPAALQAPSLTGHASVCLNSALDEEALLRHTPTFIVSGGTDGKEISDKVFAITISSDLVHYVYHKLETPFSHHARNGHSLTLIPSLNESEFQVIASSRTSGGRPSHSSLVLLFGGSDESRRLKDIATIGEIDLLNLVVSLLDDNSHKKQQQERTNQKPRNLNTQLKVKTTKKTLQNEKKMKLKELQHNFQAFQQRQLFSWLKTVEMDRYYFSFANFNVTLDLFPYLDESHLKELGIKNKEHRRRILNARNNLPGAFLPALNNTLTMVNVQLEGSLRDIEKVCETFQCIDAENVNKK